MTDPRETLDRIREQADAATEGPWTAEYSGEQGNCVLPPGYRSTREAVAGTRLWRAQADAEFIAAARADVPWLLEQVERRDMALKAVLELHKPGRTFHGHGFSQPLCMCGAPLPCPTVAAVTAALPHLTATGDAPTPERLPCGCENPLNAVHLLDH